MVNALAKTYELTNNTCYIDGVVQATTTSCDNIAKTILGIGLAIFVPLVIASLVFFVLWLVMLIHAISNQDLKDRTIWIVALVASFFLGFMWIVAIAYYFAAKRPYDKQKKTTNNVVPAVPEATIVENKEQK